jgi:hypothetical protein
LYSHDGFIARLRGGIHRPRARPADFGAAVFARTASPTLGAVRGGEVRFHNGRSSCGRNGVVGGMLWYPLCRLAEIVVHHR